MKLTLMRSVGLAFAAWPSAYGQFENFTFNNYGNDKLAPWGVNLTSFDANLAAPNATGRYPLPGPNISAPYGSPPGYMIIDGWAWNIAVTADIPLSLANHTSPGNQDQVFTGTTLQLVIPDSLLTGAPGSINAVVDESWRMCIMRWALPDDYNDSLRTDDGSCTSIMSNQCIKDIQNYTAYTYKSSASCKCPDLGKILPSCSGNGLPGGCAASSFEASEIRQWPNGTLNELRFGGNPHEKGDIAAYNLTGSIAWPVLVVWAVSDDVPSGGVVVNNTAKMACPRANEAILGSVAPGTNQTGPSGSHRHELSFYTTVFLWACWVAFYGLF